MGKRFRRNDLIFIVAAVLLIAAVCVFAFATGHGSGAYAVVTVDGEKYGVYALNEEQTVEIVIDGVTTNVLMIADGKADMTEADCPDKLCVHQRAISKKNETIVCLPNKVVVQIIGGEESELDSVAK